jgi:hypothetical protein
MKGEEGEGEGEGERWEKEREILLMEIDRVGGLLEEKSG